MTSTAKATVALAIAALVGALWACTVLVDDTCTVADDRCVGTVAVVCQPVDPTKPNDLTHAALVRHDCADAGDICADPGTCVHACQGDQDCRQRPGAGHCASLPAPVSDAGPSVRTCIAFREAGAPCEDDPASCGAGLSCRGPGQVDSGGGGAGDAAADAPSEASPLDDGGAPDAGPVPADASAAPAICQPT